jgi:hypothetical protein
MVINNLDRMSAAILPDEADAPLIVDSDAVLTSPVSFQTLKSVARGNIQTVQRDSGVEQLQLDPRRLRDGFEPLHADVVEELFSIFAAETDDHVIMI